MITYGLLDQALKKWGLIRREKDHYIVYFDEEDPIIVYPQRPENEMVPPRHLILARRQVIERGFVENQKEFEQALERAAA
jgi:hypothetical protein